MLCFQEEQSNAGELMTKVSWEMAAQYLMLILLILNLFTWSGLVSEIEISKLNLTFYGTAWASRHSVTKKDFKMVNLRV